MVEVFLNDTSVTKSVNTLTSNQAGAEYQWLDCNAGIQPVDGATSQSFSPVVSASYAVRIDKNGCIDTSACHVVILTGINDVAFGREFSIYPNPGENKVFIDLADTYAQIIINVFNAEGKEVFLQQYTNVSSIKLDADWASGLYHVVVKSGGKSTVLPFVRK